MYDVNERSELFDRAQHELEQLRYYCMDPAIEKATLKAQLDNLDRRLGYYHNNSKEQESIIEDLRSQLRAAGAKNVVLEYGTNPTAPRDSPFDQIADTHRAKAQPSMTYRAPTVESASDEETGTQQQELPNHVIEVFLTFVSVTDSRINERRAVYLRQQHSLRRVLGPQVLGRFPTDAMAFVYKAQQVCDVGQTAAEVSTLPTHFQQTSQLTTCLE